MPENKKKKFNKALALGTFLAVSSMFTVHESHVFELANNYNQNFRGQSQITTWEEACKFYELCYSQKHIETQVSAIQSSGTISTTTTEIPS